MDTLEDRIRRRAYELWEQDGRTGDPEDHWFEAERELTAEPQGEAKAPLQEAPPAETVQADQAVGSGPGKDVESGQKSRRKPVT
jgi:Protein of unknown function (DUF2934)